MANDLNRPAPPVLIPPPGSYSPSYHRQSNNVLRLFFENLTKTVRSLSSIDDNGGKFLYMPYGQFYSTTTQTAAAINTAYAVNLENTVLSNDVSITSNSRLTMATDGVYNIQVTLEANKTSANSANLYIWGRKNGTDITASAQNYEVEKHAQAIWHQNVSMTVNDYVEIVWAVDDTDIQLEAAAASSPVPAIPSADVSVIFVSNV